MRLYEFRSSIGDFRKYLTGKVKEVGGYILPNGKVETEIATKPGQQIHDPIQDKLNFSEEELFRKGAVKFRLGIAALGIYLIPSTRSTILAMQLLNKNWRPGMLMTIEFLGPKEKYYFGTDLKSAQYMIRYYDLKESKK